MVLFFGKFQYTKAQWINFLFSFMQVSWNQALVVFLLLIVLSCVDPCELQYGHHSERQ